jgi:hypothetical protein
MNRPEHYRLIHADDEKMALRGKHVRAIVNIITRESEPPPTVAQTLEACRAIVAFPCVIVDSIGHVVDRDTRRFG